MRAIVYIDGFNLYKGLLERAPQFKWLDLSAFSRNILPSSITIERIRYFTAAVQAFKDPQQPFRQQLYWRALRTLPDVEIIEGFFKVKERARIRIIPPLPDGTYEVTTRLSNEKGSDVNLATFLIHDAYQNLYDLAVIVSNDADFIRPVEIVQRVLGKEVWQLKPRPHQQTKLDGIVDKILPAVTPAILAASQFPDQILLPNGKRFTRPAEWGSSTTTIPISTPTTSP